MKKSSTGHQIASRDEWLAARTELLKAEKELTRHSDQVAKQPEELPWVRRANDPVTTDTTILANDNTYSDYAPACFSSSAS